MIRTRSLRVAIAEATHRGWSSGDDAPAAPRMSTTPSVAHGVDCGQILAAVESAPQPAAEWMLVAYAAPGYCSRSMVERVTDRLRIACVIDCGPSRSPSLSAFVESAASALAHRNLTRQPVSFRAIALRAGIDPRSKATWDRRLTSVEKTTEAWEQGAARAAKGYLQSLERSGTLEPC